MLHVAEAGNAWFSRTGRSVASDNEPAGHTRTMYFGTCCRRDSTSDGEKTRALWAMAFDYGRRKPFNDIGPIRYVSPKL